ncbi:Cysteine and histidine rich protein 1 [Paragonimus heterotremus]|uniref:Cysteine and histidine rich protein 1 n=1 Tax=Paragonimus heterotremus TaxID=100268 RepID=A0A8J4T1Q2_9TREM|nr:Cysteine and histidine rich protein 1 [Paragonimus heterotremus]
MRRIRRPIPTTHVARSAVTRVYMNNNQQLNENNSQNSVDTPAEDFDCAIEGDNSAPNLEAVNFLIANTRMERCANDTLDSTLPTVEHSDDGLQDDNKYGRILRSIREVISCCACYSSETIMKECTNGHLICQNCFLTLRQDERPQCPTCRANLYSDSRRALVAQKVLSELPDCCTDCNAQMLHKSLPNHRLNHCPKRRVACGLSALGCEWTGWADQYDAHYRDCDLKKQLTEQPVGSNIDWLVNRFRKREQTMRETFHCFSNVLRQLESHELQTVTVTLANVSTNEHMLQYRSDHFHVNQSRWTAEITMKSPVQLNLTEENPISSNSEEVINLDPPSSEVEPNTAEPPNSAGSVETTDLPYSVGTTMLEPTGTPLVRRRRWQHTSVLRHHPYYLPTANSSSTGSRAPSTIPRETQVFASSRSGRNHDYANLGEINYRMLKENSPGIGRRSYAFVLLQIRVPDTGIQIYARPQIQPFRFSNRGDQTSVFLVHPIRWRYISSLSELTKYRVIQAEIVIARRILEEHPEG